mmetsp:Transcript_90841/g.257317  ORF Transcript_90841/g.257317 Transcript_90841/m.257317 type:complete len:155 (+) Transcript_90841:88-552(+)
MFRAVLSLGGFNRAICVATGAAGGYAFTNPDIDNVYDIFPLHKPPPYAFINVYKVKEGEAQEFEQSWKDMTRFYQRQEGYLFSKMFRADRNDTTIGDEKAEFDYIDVVQWTTGDAQRRATLRPGHPALVQKLACESVRPPMMYSVVVDDTPAQV